MDLRSITAGLNWSRGQISGTPVHASALTSASPKEKRNEKTQTARRGRVFSTALAAPALAQEVIEDPGFCAQVLSERQLPKPRPGQSLHRQLSARRHLSRTATTAGTMTAEAAPQAAIATAPFGNSNAYYNTGDRGWSQSYGQRNGFVCQPGTWFRGADGLRHICQ